MQLQDLPACWSWRARRTPLLIISQRLVCLRNALAWKNRTIEEELESVIDLRQGYRFALRHQSKMVNPAMTKALIAVKAAVRMKILLNRLGGEESTSTPLLEDPDRSVGERLAHARASLRPSVHASRANSVQQDDDTPDVNWFYNDMFAIQSLLTASWLNLLAVSFCHLSRQWISAAFSQAVGSSGTIFAHLILTAFYSCCACLGHLGLGSHADLLPEHGLPHSTGFDSRGCH